MRKPLFFSFAIFAVLAMLFTAIAPSPVAAKGARSITFIGADNWNNKGLVFKFQVTGDFSPSELTGIVTMSGTKYSLDCNFNDDGILVCVASGLHRFAGRSVIGEVGGFGFTAVIPEPKNFSGTWCYSIFDWTDYGTPGWVDYGPYCQRKPAQYGDTIIFNNPVFKNSEYIFLPDYPSCNVHNGSAYYYVQCNPKGN